MERFDHYMDRALYGPDGFYTAGGEAGRARGDFITSPEVGPLFGAVLANALDSWWTAAGRPEPWTVYDVGCGPGRLLRAVERARPPHERPWRLIGVDPAGSGADIGELPDDLTGSVVIANELLDNLPFRIVDRAEDGSWREVFVADGVEVLEPVEAGNEPDALDLPPGTRAPWLERASAWCTEVMERGADRLVVFDYGVVSTSELAGRGGWLRTYRAHRRAADPYRKPGSWDITTDVAFDQLPPVDEGFPITQAEFLRAWGIDELVEEGRRYWKDHALRPDLTALAMRSRVSEAEALLDGDGLGGWLVGCWSP